MIEQIDIIFKLLSDAVRFFPAHPSGMTCKRLQTFAVLPDFTALNSENLGKNINYKDTPFFYSRAWEQLQYNPSSVEHKLPLLSVIEVTNSFENILSEDMKTTVLSTLQVAALDKIPNSDKNIVSGCDKRTAEQIYMDTEVMLISAVQYLKGVVVIINSNTLELQYMHKELFNKLKTDEVLSSDWVIEKQKSRHFQIMIRQRNPNPTGQRFAGGSNNLLGTFMNLTFAFDSCIDNTWNHDAKNYPVTWDKGRTG